MTTKTLEMLAVGKDAERILEDVLQEASNGSVEKLETLVQRRL